MRFMVMVRLSGTSAADYEAGALPAPDDIAEMMKFNEEMANAGIMVAGDGLQPTSKGARVEFPDGKAVVTDGPFAETKELYGGYWVWEVDSKQDAIEWASRCPMSEGDVVELRQIFEMEDFGPEIVVQEAERVEVIEKAVKAHQKQPTA